MALGTPLAELSIPAAGVEDDVVVQGTDELRLEEGPGHYPGTALPGEPGNVAIAGHRTTWLRPFYNLQAVTAGDPIVLRVGRLSYVYDVASVRAVLPDDTAVLAARHGWWLTLTTCTPRYSASERLVVEARLDVDATLRADATPPVAAVSQEHGTGRPAAGASGAGAPRDLTAAPRLATPAYRVTRLPAAPAVLPAVPLGVLVAWCLAIAALLVTCWFLASRRRVALVLLLPAAACCFEAYGAAARLLPGTW